MAAKGRVGKVILTSMAATFFVEKNYYIIIIYKIKKMYPLRPILHFLNIDVSKFSQKSLSSSNESTDEVLVHSMKDPLCMNN
jgi:hypothetical protein